MSRLKQEIQEHVESVSLTDDEFDALLQTEQSQPEPKNKKGLWLVAAAILFAAVGAAFFFAKSTPSNRIAAEVAYNHRKLKPLEIDTGSTDSVAEFFATHDIRVVKESKVLDQFSWSLQGARFCSIQGSDAAQLRYTDESGEVVSVYMAPYSVDSMGELPSEANPLKTVADGIEVWIWVEENQVIASTIPPSDSRPQTTPSTK